MEIRTYNIDTELRRLILTALQMLPNWKLSKKGEKDPGIPPHFFSREIRKPIFNKA